MKEYNCLLKYCKYRDKVVFVKALKILLKFSLKGKTSQKAAKNITSRMFGAITFLKACSVAPKLL